MASASLKLKLLVRYRDIWFVKMRVPKDVQATIGHKVLTKTTGETDPVKAHRKAEPIIAGWKDMIQAARSGGKTALQLRIATARAQFQRRQALQAADPDGYGPDPWEIVEDLLERELGVVASDLESEALGPEPAPVRRLARRIVEEVIGEATPFLANKDGWRAAADYKDRQLAQAVRDVEEFAEAHPDLTLEDLTGAKAQAWVEGLVTDPLKSLTKKTVQRKLWALRSYWEWLQAHQIVPTERNPFIRLRIPDRRTDSRKEPVERAPWAPADIVRLRDKAKQQDDAALADLIWFAAHTGARIEELCRLRATDVDLDGMAFTVRRSKTRAGQRTVPIHRAIQDLVRRLVADAQGKERWVIPSTAENQYGDRGTALGQRFGRLKTAMGFGPELVFHSIRKTVATLLEDAQCPEGIAADILGHDKPTMTYGLYSGGSSLATKREWLEKAVTYDQAAG